MKKKLDMARIAKALGAERHGKVRAKGGYFGAMALLTDVQAGRSRLLGSEEVQLRSLAGSHAAN